MDARLARKKKIQWKKRLRCQRFWANATRENRPLLLKYARRLTNGDESKAEDLVQEDFARIFSYLPEPDSIGSTKAYLFRVLYTRWTSSKPRAKETSLNEAVEHVVQFNVRLSEFKVVMEIVLEKMDPDFPDVNTIVAMRLAGYPFREIDQYLGRDPRYSQTIWRRFTNELRKNY